MKKKQMARKAKAESSLAIQRQKIALDEGFGAWKGENHPDLVTPDDSTAYVRTIRETDRERQQYLERLRE